MKCTGGTLVQSLRLSSIRKDEKLQPRATIDMDVVSDYAEFIRGGGDLPAVGVVFDEKTKCYWLWDGYHRAAAYEMAGAMELPATITKGSAHDAFLMSLSANATHGQRRTNADKRRAVTLALADPEIAKMSDRQVADLCAVSHPFVGEIRGQVVTVTTCGANPQASTVDTCGEEKRIGKDGKSYAASSGSKSSSGANGSHLKGKPQEGTAATGIDVVATTDGVGKPEPGDKEADPAQDSPEVYAESDDLTTKIAAGQAAIDAILRLLDEAATLRDRFAKTDMGCVLASGINQTKIDGRNYRNNFVFARPERVCDRCGGAGCNICMMRGWLAKSSKKEPVTA